MLNDNINDLKLALSNLTIGDIRENGDSIVSNLFSLKVLIEDTLNIMGRNCNENFKKVRVVPQKNYISTGTLINYLKQQKRTAREIRDHFHIETKHLIDHIEHIKEIGLLNSEILNEQEYFSINAPKEEILCGICGEPTIEGQRHHINGNREDNSSENLLFICIDCHKSIHKKRSNYPIYKDNPELLKKIEEYSEKFFRSKKEQIESGLSIEEAFAEESSK